MLRNPVLDGWRGIAILFVLFDHWLRYLDPDHPSWWFAGQHGVTIFFVLSGFLITSKLMEPDIDLRSFYIRRFFKLTPVVWIYLLLIFTIGVIINRPLLPKAELFSCVLFYRNYFVNTGRGFTIPLWSLSVEEQFYLIWPALLLFSGLRTAKWIALIGAALSGLWAIVSQRIGFYDASLDTAHWYSELRFSGLLVGCFFALTLQSPSARARFVLAAKWLAFPCTLLLCYLIRRNDPVPTLLESLSWAVLIIGSSLTLKPAVLSWAPLAWLGRISYSVYVWQWLCFYLFRAFYNPFCFVLVCLIPLASYYGIEKPMTRIGHLLASKSKRPELLRSTVEA